MGFSRRPQGTHYPQAGLGLQRNRELYWGHIVASTRSENDRKEVQFADEEREDGALPIALWIKARSQAAALQELAPATSPPPCCPSATVALSSSWNLVPSFHLQTIACAVWINAYLPHQNGSPSPSEEEHRQSHSCCDLNTTTVLNTE